MALQNNDLVAGPTTRGPLPRVHPAQGPGASVAVLFAAGTALLAPGTPVYKAAATGFVTKLDPSSVTAEHKEIYGVVWPHEVQLLAGGEVHGVIMTRGSVNYDDLEALRAAGTLAGTAQQLKDVLRNDLHRQRGIHIEGLDKLGGTAGLA